MSCHTNIENRNSNSCSSDLRPSFLFQSSSSACHAFCPFQWTEWSADSFCIDAASERAACSSQALARKTSLALSSLLNGKSATGIERFTRTCRFTVCFRSGVRVAISL
jgi:hypothetical protein